VRKLRQFQGSIPILFVIWLCIQLSHMCLVAETMIKSSCTIGTRIGKLPTHTAVMNTTLCNFVSTPKTLQCLLPHHLIEPSRFGPSQLLRVQQTSVSLVIKLESIALISATTVRDHISFQEETMAKLKCGIIKQSSVSLHLKVGIMTTLVRYSSIQIFQSSFLLERMMLSTFGTH